MQWILGWQLDKGMNFCVTVDHKTNKLLEVSESGEKNSGLETTMQYSRLSNIKAQKDYYEAMDKVMLGEYAKL